MAEKSTESRNGGRQTAPAPAEEASPAAEAVKAPSSRKAWLPLIVTVVTMPLLAWTTTRFVLVPQMKRAFAIPDAAPAAAKEGAKEGASGDAAKATGTAKVTVPLSKILVNVAGTMGTRYLMTSITLAGTEADLKEKVEANKDQLLDLATGTLCTKTIGELEKPTARNVIRAELM